MALGWFAALIAFCYWPVLVHLVAQWNNDEDMGHGFFVPILAAYIAWQKRDEFLAAPAKPNWLGLALVIYAGLQLWIATLGAELFLARTAIVLSIIGAVLFLGGTKRARVMAFPLFLLFFMIPIPAILYNQISVVEACSGIRSLLTLSFLSLVYGYFFETKTWLRVVLFLATVPIAIVANASRVTVTGIIADSRPELAHGLFHTAEGFVIWIVSITILALFHQMVDKTYKVLRAQR